MKDLFTSPPARVAVHLKTMTQVIVTNAYWYKGCLTYDCLVPQKEPKGYELCHSAFKENEISFEKMKCNGIKIELEEII